MKIRLPLYSNSDSCCYYGTRMVCFSALLLFLLCSDLAADIPELLPGTEVRITAPETEKTFLVYVPVDYTDKRPFPIIFYYHGWGGKATTWMLKKITKGGEFIVVGMNYATDAYYKGLSPDATAADIRFFEEVLTLLSTRLNIATDYIFMGGYSQGGYSTTVLGEQLLGRLAGRLVLGAGRRDVDRNPPPPTLIQGHPILFGVGALDDPHYRRAKRASEIYREWGADVTFEAWTDETHKLSSEWLRKTRIREWLIAHGPTKQVESGCKMAETAETEDRMGEAFRLYGQIAEILPDTILCRRAKKAAERLATEAEAKLNLIKETADKKSYAELVKALGSLRETYNGSIFAERAAQVLYELLNAKADALEERARAAEIQKNYTRALQLYKLYLTYFTEAERYSEVEKRMKALKNKIGVK
ncbi:MAG: hypothetical protein OXN25_01320 [Candidatus Poribacteria bacterium]|nr:hypothetical protein [Candidatus Poribacteria bacterium]